MLIKIIKKVESLHWKTNPEVLIPDTQTLFHSLLVYSVRLVQNYQRRQKVTN